jgi:putative FmdB family regulatory protein
MPRFDFECPQCGRTFEEFQKMSQPGEERTALCPCGAKAIRKWTNGATFRFTFREGYDACTGMVHPTKRHYENAKRELGLVKVE